MEIPEWVVYEPQKFISYNSGDGKWGSICYQVRYLVRPASWFIDGRLLPVSPHGEKMEGTP